MKSKVDDHQVLAMLNGIRGLVGLLGPAIAKPHEKMFENYKKSGATTFIKDAATDLLDDMACRRYMLF